MKMWVVTADLLREASQRRWFLAMGGLITLILGVLLASLKLEVVDGALAASHLFGKLFGNGQIQAVDVALRPVFEASSYVIFYAGMGAGIFGCADFGPTLLSPGRIEHLLALPVRRWELLFGTFAGVLLLAWAGALYGAGGLTLVLGIKTGVWTVRPLLSALLAGLGFGAVYAAMLVSALFVRSAAMSGLVGAFFFVGGIVASYRTTLAPMFERGITREAFSFVTLAFPRVASLAELSAQLASSGHVTPAVVAQRLASFAVFTLAVLVLGVFWFERKDF